MAALSLREDLSKHMHFWLKNHDDGSGGFRWVMNSEWFKELLFWTDGFGYYLLCWKPGDLCPFLYGYPVEVTDSATVPVLEPCYP
jgi:hypothetical protein